MPDPDVEGRERELAAEATRLHAFYRGKMETVPRCRVRDLRDFALWYTPGVAAPCLAIQADPELAYEYTSKGNTVAVVSDGTRVLGLGDIGPAAGLPVMEGKALLYKYLGGVDAVPIVLDTRDPDELIRTVLLLSPSFGGVNLEDIAQPKCFRILERLREESPIPVWHDDQQGTATVTLAGLLNALQVTGRRIGETRIVFVGSGAANVACSRLVALDQVGVHGDFAGAEAEEAVGIRLARDEEAAAVDVQALVERLVEEDLVLGDGAVVAEAEVGDAGPVTLREVAADPIFGDLVTVGAGANHQAAAGPAQTAVVRDLVVVDPQVLVEAVRAVGVDRVEPLQVRHADADAAVVEA